MPKEYQDLDEGEVCPIEKAARALATSERGHDDDWWFYLEDIRIVLSAMRDPFLGMRLAAEDKCYLVGPKEIPDMFRAMIDAATARLEMVEEKNRPYQKVDRDVLR